MTRTSHLPHQQSKQSFAAGSPVSLGWTQFKHHLNNLYMQGTLKRDSIPGRQADGGLSITEKAIRSRLSFIATVNRPGTLLAWHSNRTPSPEVNKREQQED